MDQSEFDDLRAQARQVGEILKTVFQDVTGEDLELEAAIRHYPLVALGIAAGAGAVAGWWVGRRRAKPALPPPVEPPTISPNGTMDYLQHLFPGIEHVRGVVPDAVADEAIAIAKNWMDTVLEPKLKQGLDNFSATVADSKWGEIFRQAVHRVDPQEDVELEDPPESR